MTGGGATENVDVTEVIAADAALGAYVAGDRVDPGWDTARAVTVLYTEHYRSLVRLAILLVRDVATAEEVVQDSFIAAHGAWPRLRDNDRALAYLRQSVVNTSLAVLRRRMVVDANAPRPVPDMTSALQGALSLLERSAVSTALRTLPSREREALVLKFYADLSEAQIATAMGISRGAVRSHTERGIANLGVLLELDSGAAETGADHGEDDRRVRVRPLPSSYEPTADLLMPTESPEPSRKIGTGATRFGSSSHLHRLLSWRWWLIPKPAADVLSATRQELLGRAWRELEHEISAFYRELGPPPGFESGGNRG